jgi:hypothetical protein
LCYCCKYEGQPLVFVFARRSSEPLARLVAGLDKSISEHASDNLQAVVSLLNADQDVAEKEALKLSEASTAKNIPFVIPFESDNGPVKHHINPRAEWTVIFVKEGRVLANFAYRGEEADEKAARRILETVEARFGG